MRLVPPNLGTHHPDGADATIATIGGSDPYGLAAYLLRLGTPLRVLSPDDAREALRHRIRDLLNDQEG
jgi:hypothetical protein